MLSTDGQGAKVSLGVGGTATTLRAAEVYETFKAPISMARIFEAATPVLAKVAIQRCLQRTYQQKMVGDAQVAGADSKGVAKQDAVVPDIYSSSRFCR